jgi:hypothetical protein
VTVSVGVACFFAGVLIALAVRRWFPAWNWLMLVICTALLAGGAVGNLVGGNRVYGVLFAVLAPLAGWQAWDAWGVHRDRS